MTLLYLDGFAHANQGRYSYTNGQVTSWAQTAGPRTTGGYYGVSNSALAGDARRSIPAASEVFTGVGAYLTSLDFPVLAMWGDSGATQHLTLSVNASGLLELRRGTSGGTLLGTGATAVTANSWHYYEMRATIADSGGVCQVRLDGQTTPEIDYTGDTKNGGTATTIDAVSIRVSAANCRHADWYILDTAGSVNVTWRGDTVVRTLTPSGNGASSMLVGSDADSVNNYLLVDEVPPSSSDYTGSASVGAKDTYAMSDLPGTATGVYGVQVAAVMAKSDAGTASAKVVTRVGGSDYAATTTALGTSYVETLALRETSPATSSAWTVAEVNAMEAGMEVA